MSDQVAFHLLTEGTYAVVISSIFLIATSIIIRTFSFSASTRHFVCVLALSSSALVPGTLIGLPGRLSIGPVLQEAPQARSLSSQPEQKGFEANSRAYWYAQVHWSRFLKTIILLWGMGMIIVSIPVFASLHSLRSARRQSVASDRDFSYIRGMASRLGIRPSWKLHISKIPTPGTAMTWGTTEPFILLPKNSADWDTEQFRTAVLHELAHVRRYDSLSLKYAFACCAVLWFNPFVWRCARNLRFHAESAADDLVLSLGIRPSDYATVLLDLVSRDSVQTSVRLSGICRMERLGIHKRIAAVLNASANRTATSIAGAARVSVACVAVGLFVLTLRPQFAGFAAQSANRVSNSPHNVSDQGASPDRLPRQSSRSSPKRDDRSRDAAQSSPHPRSGRTDSRAPSADLVTGGIDGQTTSVQSADRIPQGEFPRPARDATSPDVLPASSEHPSADKVPQSRLN
jgi:beta-lactamase regulating signal transducer with metallopeptidase domain